MVLKDRNQSYDRRKSKDVASHSEKIYLPDLSYFFDLIRRNFLRLHFLQSSHSICAFSIMRFEYNYVSYETITYSSLIVYLKMKLRRVIFLVMRLNLITP